MTVQELIDNLNRLPKDKEVRICGHDYYGFAIGSNVTVENYPTHVVVYGTSKSIDEK